MTANIQFFNAKLNQSCDIGLFSFLRSRQQFEHFCKSTGHNVLFPLIGISYLIQAGLDLHKLYHASERDFTLYANAATSSIGAVLSNTAIIGSLAAGSAFAAGPFLFVAALGLSAANQAIQFGSNMIKAFKSDNKKERNAYLLKAGKNLFQFILLSFVTALIITAMITPAAPAVVAALAFTAIGLTSAKLGAGLASHLKNNGEEQAQNDQQDAKEPLLAAELDSEQDIDTDDIDAENQRTMTV